MPMDKAVSMGLSRMGFFAIALVIGPLLGCAAVVFLAHGLADSLWGVVVGLAVPVAFASGLGRVAGRSTTEIVIALAGSVAATCILAVTLIVIWLLTLPPDFFN